MNSIQPSEVPLFAAARDPALDRLAGVRARRFATELSPCGARPLAQPVGDQPSDPRAGRAVRHQTVRARRAFGAADGRRRTLFCKSLGRAGGAARRQPRHAAASPRCARRTLDQLAAVLHLGRADPGAAGVQAAPSTAYAAHRGHASICPSTSRSVMAASIRRD